MLRQHRAGEGQNARATEKRGGGAKLKIYRGNGAQHKENRSAQAWLERGSGKLTRVTEKTREQLLQARKTSSGNDGSKNDRQRRVSTETKRQGAKLKPKGDREHKNAERDLPGNVGKKTR